MSNMVVRTNVFALNAHRNMKNVGLEQGRASNRLSSGFRINSAADDAAGLAISETMRAQIRGLDQASRNAQDGQAMLLTTEGGLEEIGNMLQRTRELLVQAANDTNTQDQRTMIEQEINQLSQEIASMQQRVEFNTNRVLAMGPALTSEISNSTAALNVDNLRVTEAFNRVDANRRVVQEALEMLGTVSGSAQFDEDIAVSDFNERQQALIERALAAVGFGDIATAPGMETVVGDFVSAGTTALEFADHMQLRIDIATHMLNLQGLATATTLGVATTIEIGIATEVVRDFLSFFDMQIVESATASSEISIAQGSGPNATIVLDGMSTTDLLATATHIRNTLTGTVTTGNAISDANAWLLMTDEQRNAQMGDEVWATLNAQQRAVAGAADETAAAEQAAILRAADALRTMTVGDIRIAAFNIAFRDSVIGIPSGAGHTNAPAAGIGGMEDGVNFTGGEDVEIGHVWVAPDTITAVNIADGTTAIGIQGLLNDRITDLESAIDDLNAVRAGMVSNNEAIYNEIQDWRGATSSGNNVAFFQVGANANQGIQFDFESVSRAVSTAAAVVNMASIMVSNPGGGSGIGRGIEVSPLISQIQSSLDDINSIRANLGAVQNRMDYTMRSLDISSENLSDSESRVRNADIAREMMRFTMANVLQQASVSMLAQANQLPNNLLQLLR